MTTPQPTGDKPAAALERLQDQIAEELRELGIDDPHSPEGRALLGAGYDLVYPEQARRSAGRWITPGEVDVVMRRIDQLKLTIDFMTIHRVDTSDLQRAYDQVLRALTKTFGLPR